MPSQPLFDDWYARTQPLPLPDHVTLDLADVEDVRVARDGSNRWAAYWVVRPHGRRRGRWQTMRSHASGARITSTRVDDVVRRVVEHAELGDIAPHTLIDKTAADVLGVDIEIVGPVAVGVTMHPAPGRGRDTRYPRLTAPPDPGATIDLLGYATDVPLDSGFTADVVHINMNTGASPAATNAFLVDAPDGQTKCWFTTWLLHRTRDTAVLILRLLPAFVPDQPRQGRDSVQQDDDMTVLDPDTHHVDVTLPLDDALLDALGSADLLQIVARIPLHDGTVAQRAFTLPAQPAPQIYDALVGLPLP